MMAVVTALAILLVAWPTNALTQFRMGLIETNAADHWTFSSSWAARRAVHDWNSADGSIVPVVASEHCELYINATSIPAAEKGGGDRSNMHGIVGPAQSSCSVPGFDLIDEAPSVPFLSTSPTWDEQERFPYVFRKCFSFSPPAHFTCHCNYNVAFFADPILSLQCNSTPQQLLNLHLDRSRLSLTLRCVQEPSPAIPTRPLPWLNGSVFLTS